MLKNYFLKKAYYFVIRSPPSNVKYNTGDEGINLNTRFRMASHQLQAFPFCSCGYCVINFQWYVLIFFNFAYIFMLLRYSYCQPLGMLTIKSIKQSILAKPILPKANQITSPPNNLKTPVAVALLPYQLERASLKANKLWLVMSEQCSVYSSFVNSLGKFAKTSTKSSPWPNPWWWIN